MDGLPLGTHDDTELGLSQCYSTGDEKCEGAVDGLELGTNEGTKLGLGIVDYLTQTLVIWMESHLVHMTVQIQHHYNDMLMKIQKESLRVCCQVLELDQ